MRMAGVLVIPWLKGERLMHQIKIDIVKPEPAQAFLQSRLDPFGSMVVVPQLSGDEQVLAPNDFVGQQLFDGHSHLSLIAVSLCSVEMAEADFDRGPDGATGLGVVGQ